MVESVFVIIPLLALLLGLLDFGFAVFLKNTFQHAVREGVRYAITSQTKTGMGQIASIQYIVQENALGFLNGSSGAAVIFIRFYVPGTLAQVTGPGSNIGGNIVEVSIEGYTWSWMSFLLKSRTPLTLTARSSDRMEGSPSTGPPAL